jgi:hypothetical protein
VKTIHSIVEGYGEVAALPLLLRRLTTEATFSRPSKTSGRHHLIKEGVFERFLERERIEYKLGRCDGLLILLDADEDCAAQLAWGLAERAANLNLPFPVAVVCAKCEYEAWFLTSLETIAGNHGIPSGTTISEDEIETTRGVKEWLSDQMGPTRAYSPTTHQPAFTTLIDLDLVHQRSRSFRRLEHALQEILEGEVGVTPSKATIQPS